jgi:hypothetical protein
MKLKILYLNTNTPDYLAESLFHGLRSILGENCVDLPRYDSMYAPLTQEKRSTLRGHGFTIYGLLPDVPALDSRRNSWKKELDTYDLVVIADIWKLHGVFKELIKEVPFSKVVILDGSDSPAIFPYGGAVQRLKKDPFSFFLPIHKVKYFKRELMGEGEAYNLKKIVPWSIRKRLKYPGHVIPINFSIPAEKISKVGSGYKNKMFNRHIVDEEVARNEENSFFSSIGSDRHYFVREEEYYEDLKRSKFGITTKRMGWDCMRHYELAANGSVLCFKDLDQKDPFCAPRGLNTNNCIAYQDYADLMKKINSLSPERYKLLLKNNYDWIEENTTTKVAQKFIQDSLEIKVK